MTITLDRNLAAATDTEVKKSSLITAPILYLDFPTLTKYYAGTTTNITLGSGTVMPAGTYVGVGGIASVAVAEETTELKSTRLVCELNGLDSTYIALVLAEQYFGRDASYGLAVLDSSYKVVGEPIILFKGYISMMNINLEEKAKITVEIESILADWERPRVMRYNDNTQETIDPTDDGFNNVAKNVHKEVVWG